jgi:hypothetical protein
MTSSGGFSSFGRRVLLSLLLEKIRVRQGKTPPEDGRKAEDGVPR